MAVSNTKKKSQSSKKRSSLGKNTSRDKTAKKKQVSSDLLTKLLLIAGVIAIIVMLISFYKEDKEKEAGSNVTPTVIPTLTLVPTTNPESDDNDEISTTPKPTVEAEPTQVATQAATQAPTKAPTPAPTEEPVKKLTSAEALTVLRKEINEEIYTISMLNDHLMLGDGKEYYMFCISDETGDLEPLLLVQKDTGELKCYTLEGVLSDFSGFPLDNVETPEPSSSEISKEKALELLKALSKKSLGLAKELSEYDEITYDDWTTLVNGSSCYSLNVFELSNGKMRLRGTYYVSLDGSKLYKLDGETNEFIPLK